MRFKAVALIQIGSAATGGSVGIAMAWLDFCYWSLVGMQLSPSIAVGLVTWLGCRLRPQVPVGNSGDRAVLNFCANLTSKRFFVVSLQRVRQPADRQVVRSGGSRSLFEGGNLAKPAVGAGYCTP